MIELALLAASQATTIRLDSLDLSGITQGWGSPRANLSVDGNPLTIAGRQYAFGVGTHAHSDWSLYLNRRGNRFLAKVGLDDETKQGSVRFLVIGDGKKLFDSGVMRSGQEAKAVDVPVTGVRLLKLVVEDGGDTLDFDHANWAEAAVVMQSPAAKILNAPKPKPEPTMKIAMPDLLKTQIHGPRAVGTTPGRDFIFRVPATGRKPFNFSAEGLPAGLSLDRNTGVVMGAVKTRGDYPVKFTLRSANGMDSRVIHIRAQGQLALTPPMGWNSWNVWGLSVDTDKVRAAADSFEQSGLADFGYNFINIDDGWEKGRAPNGEILTNEKFPDMASLSTYVHSKGLKLGIYSSPGPQTCGGYEGSYQHEFQDAQSYAKWGIDYLKHDWCSYGGVAKPGLMGLQEPYLLMRRALDASGRDIVYSLCQYGMGNVWEWGHRVGGNLWRTTGDITDTWSSMSGIGFGHSDRGTFIRPGGWNDPDMLVVGQLGWGPSIRPTRLTGNEQITHITLWSMLAAPLLIGCDLTKLDPFTKALLMNHDVIEVDQDPLGKPAVKVADNGDTEVWTRPLFDGSYAVALFNRGHERTTVSFQLPRAGQVRDLWRQKEIGRKTSVSEQVPSHGAMMFRVTP